MRALSFLLCIGLVTLPLGLRGEDVSAPAILQYFESRYETIEERAPDIFKSGYGMMYTPPPGRADQGNFSVGYDQYDRFDLGQPGNYTLYGSETGLKKLVRTIHAASMDYYVDFVINHDGYSDLSSKDGQGHTFYDAGGYPGMCITLPEAVDGDFHSAFDYSTVNERLAGLIDIDHGTNFRFYRNPVPGIVPGAGDGGNIRAGTIPAFGRIANVPDVNNKRFYPDRSLQPIFVFDPHTGEQNIAVYPFNLASPLNGAPKPENVTGYLMRNAQWLVQTAGIDGFRLDAAKHVQGFALDYFDRAVYRTSFRGLLNGQQKQIFSWCEVYDGDQNYLQTFVVKNIDPNNPGRIGGNRDTLDFPLFFALHDNLTSNGFTNNWFNIENATLDMHDDGLHNGSQGVMFVSSHDNFGPDLSNIGYAYMLMHPGNAIVYFNAHEFGDANARNFPKDGRGDALGGLFGNAIPGLVDIRNRYGRGNYVERWIEKENFAYERSGSALVMLSNRTDSGYDSRTLLTNFNPGTRLVELTGNASSNISNPFHDVPELVVVNNDKTVNVRFLRNSAPGTGTFTGNGYLIYGLPSPQGSLSLTNVASTIQGGTPTTATNGIVRLADIKVITADSFNVVLDTIAVNLLGCIREKEADGDNALLRMDEGLDLNNNGVVDYTSPGTTYGFENFSTVHTPGYFTATGNGRYVQTIDATKLSEGMHFLTVRCFRHRDDGGPAIFTDFKQALYIDRLKPVSGIDSFNALVAGVNESRQVRVRSLDFTANNVHVFMDLPAAIGDAQVLAMINGGTQAGKIDRDLFAYGFNNVSNGNHVFTTVSFERTGNVSVQRFPGNYTSTAIGAGLGDTNFDGIYSPADIDIFRALLASHNTQFNPAADINGDGLIDTKDLLLLNQILINANADAPTMTAYMQLVNDLSTFNAAPTANPDTVTTAENTTLNIPFSQLTANDSPGPGAEQIQTLTIIGVSPTGTRGGTVALGNNAVVYVPPAHFNGKDTFTYTVQDNGVSNGHPDFKSAVGQVTVIVTEVNDPPVANVDALTTAENVALSVNSSILTANDSPGPLNEGNQTLTLTAVSAASAKSGSVKLVSGKVTYSPPLNFAGSDSFTYTVTDNGTTNGLPDPKSATGSVVVTVSEVNQPPLPIADVLTTAEDTPATVSAASLAANDAPGPPNEVTQTLTVTAAAAASVAGGTVALSNGNIVYTPPATFNGNDRFTYTVTDNGTTAGHPDFKSALGVVNVTVTEVNHPPIAIADTLSANLNAAKTFAASILAANDLPGPPNEAGQTLTVIGVSTPSSKGGSVALSGGMVTYTPPSNYTGADSFTYTVRDNGTTHGVPDLMSANGTVTVNVTDPNGNQPPIPGANSITTAENAAKIVTTASLLANDLPGPPNESAQTITITAVKPLSARGGTATLAKNGNVTYTPPVNFSGADSFSYTVTDDGAPIMSATGTVFVTVTEVNSTPTANPDALSTAEDTPLVLDAGVLAANDTPGPASESAQTLTVTAVSAASAQGGTVTLNAGTLTYTPPADFNGIDTFTYTVTDNGTTAGAADPKSAQGTVTVTVTEVNDPPLTAPDAITTTENTALAVDASMLLANDSAGPANETGQTLAVTAVSPVGMHGGTIVLNGTQITYTPPADFFGLDSFTYTVTDNGTTHGTADPKSTQGLVNITIKESNAAPLALPDALRTAENNPLMVDASVLTTNDQAGPLSENGQTLTLTAVSSTSTGGGTVTLTGTTITYTPPPDFFGIDTFTYTITDNGTTSGLPDPKSAIGTVTVTVTAVNAPPVAKADSFSTNEDKPLDIAAALVLANDVPGPANESGQKLTVTDVSAKSAQGGAVVLSKGVLTYTPPVHFYGSDSFTYTVTDDGLTDGTLDPKSATATVTVNVAAVNQPPTAFSDTVTAYQNEALSIPVAMLLANDIPGPANEKLQKLTVSGVAPASAMNGTVTLARGIVTYTPPPQYSGADSFVYTITDDGTSGGVPDPKSATGQVLVNILPKTHAPTGGTVTALPAAVEIDEIVNFSAAFTNIDAAPLTITWDFGDKTAGTGGATSHSFAAAGTYTVTATAVDNRGLSATATAAVSVAGEGLRITKASIKLNFSARAKSSDSISAAGTLPPGSIAAGAVVQVDIGGALQTFVVDTHGKSKSGKSTLALKYPRRGKGGSIGFTLTLKQGSFAAPLAGYGLVNGKVSKAKVRVPFGISVDKPVAHAWRDDVALVYSAKTDHSGSAK